MFKGLLKDWVTELFEKFYAVGQNEGLAAGIADFNRSLYGWVETIMEVVVMPVAYVILALFFVLELYNASVRIDGAGGGASFGAEMVFKVMFKLVLCKVAVDSALLLMEAIYSVSQTIIVGISSVAASGNITGGDGLAAIIRQIDGMGLGEQIGMLLELVIVKFGVWVILGLVEIISIGRFIEIYVFVAIAPIPIATLPSAELSQIGKGFFKGFAAVCLQGVFIYLVLTFFPVLFNASILGNDVSAFSLLLYSLILIISIFASGRWAKTICNAM